MCIFITVTGNSQSCKRGIGQSDQHGHRGGILLATAHLSQR